MSDDLDPIEVARRDVEASAEVFAKDFSALVRVLAERTRSR